jgi:cephalosporin hydroxylase
MTFNSQVRTIVRPIIGQRAWTQVRAGGRRVRRFQAEQAQVRERRTSARELSAISGDLTKLAAHFGTDKWGAHRYAQHYQTHLQHLRDRPMSILEIGIGGYSRAGQGGASLRMWKHFFPAGRVVGLDLQDKSFVEEDRIRAYQGDQTDPELLRRIVAECGPFDVIIDDGSHQSAHIIASFGILFPLLKGDGLYVVEDTQTSYWPERGGSADLQDESTSMAFLRRMTDGLNYEEFVDETYRPTYNDTHITGLHFYHNLVFIQKGVNAEGTRKKAILKKRYPPR